MRFRFPLLSLLTLASTAILVHSVPHRHIIAAQSYQRRQRTSVGSVRNQRRAGRVVWQRSNAVDDEPIPLLVEPPQAPNTTVPSNTTTATASPVAVLFAPPVVKKANTRVCTRRATATAGGGTITLTASPTTTVITTVTSTIKTSKQTANTKSSTSTATSAKSSATGSSPFVAAYYPDWTTMTPEKIDFDRFDWIDFAFAVPNSKFVPAFTGDDSEDLLRRLVTAAHGAGKKVKLSVGGWTGSKYFSTAVSTSSNRQTFANNILAVYNKFNVDGIDIDWEYPGTSGNDGNIISSSDSANYLSFLKVLRATLPGGAVITAATQVWPFAGSNGAPMKDVSAFAQYFDWILLMNYDVWGSSSTPGPNAPLADGCRNSSQPLANAVAAVKSWTDAGMPASKLTLGVPSYAYISKSTATRLTGRASVTVKNDDGGTTNGQVQFNSLISQGALQKRNGAYIGAGGFTRYWDSCSSTPFLRSSAADQVITYDDPESLQLKAQFAKEAGIKGVNMFDVHGDTASWELIDAVRSGLGLI
ncbi:glycoside hydrolase family 18 protein [Tulasnella calospora MUT 4182]|uniref:Glycoside hydrolase family 18 protein n=1 Tax=Tulasnella calospora MUT 4182 TaxID=1051891 RepID=A0A0C3L8S9_9AGAM|nr:glycoside hydrolase family 18 protein [Tulasnella calospora MUT 4182]